MRMGFLYLQRIDDLCDGDLLPPTGFTSEQAARNLADRLIERVVTDAPCGSMADTLYTDLMQLAVKCDWEPGDVTTRLRDVVEVMNGDLDRREQCALWNHEDIDNQLRRTFTASLDLMLLASRSRVRAAQLPALVDALGWCSVVRDLKEDLHRGLCNIPAEIAEAAKLTVSTLETSRFNIQATDLVSSSPVIDDWWHRERERAATLLDKTTDEIERARAIDRTGARIASMFARSVRMWHMRTQAGAP